MRPICFPNLSIKGGKALIPFLSTDFTYSGNQSEGARKCLKYHGKGLFHCRAL
jgi:hypothetical protein